MNTRLWLMPCAAGIALGVLLLAGLTPEADSNKGGEPTPPPVFAVLNNSGDLGCLDPEAGEVTHRVALQNVSGRTVRIQKLLTGCGCMDAKLDKSVVLADDTLELEVLLRVPNGVTKLHKAVVLQTDVSENPVATIPLYGQVAARLSVSPARLVFEPVPASELPVVGEIDIFGAAGPFQVTSRDGVVAAEQILEGEGPRIRVTLQGDRIGAVADTVEIVSATGERAVVPVSGMITREVRFSPESVVLVEGGMGDGRPIEVALRWGKQSSSVASLDAPAWLRVECPETGHPERLTVAFNADSYPGGDPRTSEAAISMTTVDGEVYTLPVYVLAETL